MKQNREEIEEILDAERAWADAHLHGDIDVLAALMHDDYVIIRPDGSISPKPEALASYRGNDRYWEIAQSDEHDVRLYGSTAVVIGRWRGVGVNGQSRFDYTGRYLSVWVKVDDGWHMVVDQSTPIS